MAEIYRDNRGYTTPQGFAFDILTATPVEAKFERNNEVIFVTSTFGTGNSVAIPYEIISLGGDFRLTWTYTVGTKTYFRSEDHRVITPLFIKQDLVDWDPTFSSLTDDKVKRLEKIIRSVIEGVTGQVFNFEYKTIGFDGNGGSTIGLNKRLVSASGIIDPTGGLGGSAIGPDNDGWSLRIATGPSWVDNFAASSGPITDPWYVRGTFREGQRYYIQGFWGYYSVPEDVLVAAKILAEDYGCDESLWRDRYLASIRAADFRFDFRPEAFRGTGNVKADQLLEKYTLVRYSVI